MLFPMVFLAVTTAVVYGRARRAQIALDFADVATVGVAAGKAVTHLAVGEGSYDDGIGTYGVVPLKIETKAGYYSGPNSGPCTHMNTHPTHG